MQEIWVQFLDQEGRLEKEWQPIPVLLPRESHGGRSLVGYSPWGRKESETTERLHFHFQTVPQKFILPYVWRPEVWNQGFSRADSFWALRENQFYAPLLASRGFW